MSNEIGFTVVRGGERIDAAERRPIRVLPDKVTAGVVYRKAVYPLRIDKTTTGTAAYYIDVGDPPSDKDSCGFAQDGAALIGTSDGNQVGFAVKSDRPAPPLDWYMESNAYGHYVLFDGDRELLNRVLVVLRAAGLAYLRAAPSYRPADNGRTYAWFIRLASEEDDPADLRRQINRALANGLLPARALASNGSAAAVPANSELVALQVELAGLKARLVATQSQQANRIAALERELAAAHASRRVAADECLNASHANDRLKAESNTRAVVLRDLQQRCEALEKRHATTMRLFEEERANAQQAAARRVTSSGDTSLLSQQLRAMQAKEQSARSELEAAQAELASTRSALSAAKAAVDGERQRSAALLVQIHQAEDQRRQSDERVSAAERDREGALKLAEEQEEKLLEQLAAIQQAHQNAAAESGMIADPDRIGASTDDESETVAYLLRYLLPRLELDRDAIDEIVNRQLHIKASALWTALKAVNDYGGDRRGNGSIQAWATLEGSKWKELRDHISDGHASHFLRVYMLQPAGNIRHARIRLLFKKERQQQKRFHAELDRRPWTPYQLRADGEPDRDEPGVAYLRIVTSDAPPFEPWLAPG